MSASSCIAAAARSTSVRAGSGRAGRGRRRGRWRPRGDASTTPSARRLLGAAAAGGVPGIDDEQLACAHALRLPPPPPGPQTRRPGFAMRARRLSSASSSTARSRPAPARPRPGGRPASVSGEWDQGGLVTPGPLPGRWGLSTSSRRLLPIRGRFAARSQVACAAPNPALSTPSTTSTTFSYSIPSSKALRGPKLELMP